MKSFYSLFPVGLLALLLLASCLPVAAQAPAWQSAQAVAVASGAATNPYSVVTATAVDAAGNVFLAGQFTNTVALGGTTLTSLGSYDVFVAKFNPASNQFVWAQRAGGTGTDYVRALAVSGASLYVAGAFASATAGFGPTTLTNASASSSGDVFVAKLTDAGPTGSFAWAQRAGSTGDDIAYALALSGTSIYVAGAFAGATASFGPTTLTNAGPSNSSDVFLAKLIDAGATSSFAWAQRAGGTDIDYANALAISGNNVYLAGTFAGATAGFGSITLTNAGAGAGTPDVFVAKLTDAGPTSSFAWAQRAGGTDYDVINALAVSGTSVYVAGGFGSSIADFGPATLASTGFLDVFVAKITDAGSTGSFVWARRAGGTQFDTAYALAVSGTGVYLTGTFGSPTAGFGSTTLTNADATTGFADTFVAKLTDVGSTGNFVWAQRAGGMGSDVATTMAVSGSSVYAAGYLDSPTASFGPAIITKPTANSFLGFLASLTDPTLTATTAAGPREPAALFPNPARHAATLRLPVGTAPAPLTLSDALGRAVRRYPAPTGPEAVLDLRGLPAGLYLLHGAGSAQRLAVE
ncbi:T9SS type A sorting domain-containing protein [Hymenobacter rubidus]|uniref:T9SS type A sorting domain-containing protein n=1 Tax=Hymenobacter rubidus TaxID=1441626 RepID=UPI00191F1392|nr:T9SS type A sorting domain-containing protein [Hymenobacter rubidus]